MQAVPEPMKHCFKMCWRQGRNTCRLRILVRQHQALTANVQDGGTPVIVYARPEDEFYHKHCSWSYTFPVTNKDIAKDELQPLRLVLSITPQQVTAAR